jgi:beta-lactam-binding protein with PASTA domain
MQQTDAENAIKAAGFVPRVFTTDDTTEPKGTVIDQSPSKNEPLSAGSTVTIQVSSFVEPSESESPTESPTPSETPSDTASPGGPAGRVSSRR